MAVLSDRWFKTTCRACAQSVEEAGGVCLVNHAVEEIIVKKHVAVGVRVTHQGKELSFTAPIIVSNAGGVNTFCKLIDKVVWHMERERAERCKRGPSAVVLFLGLKDDPRRHNFGDMNYWLFSQLEYDDRLSRPGTNDPKIPVRSFRLVHCATPVKNPYRTSDLHGHTEQWDAYEHLPWKRRGEQYEQEKQAMAERCFSLSTANCRVSKDLSTIRKFLPLTIQSFTGHRQGMIMDKNAIALGWLRTHGPSPHRYATST